MAHICYKGNIKTRDNAMEAYACILIARMLVNKKKLSDQILKTAITETCKVFGNIRINGSTEADQWLGFCMEHNNDIL
jgi:hypothetical protein